MKLRQISRSRFKENVFESTTPTPTKTIKAPTILAWCRTCNREFCAGNGGSLGLAVLLLLLLPQRGAIAVIATANTATHRPQGKVTTVGGQRPAVVGVGMLQVARHAMRRQHLTRPAMVVALDGALLAWQEMLVVVGGRRRQQLTGAQATLCLFQLKRK